MGQDIHAGFNYSVWEREQYFTRFDLAIIGSGIVGLSVAVSFLKRHPKARVVVLERGFLPEGASSKNAGFACFGSAGELLADLAQMEEASVWETVEMRWKGLRMLRKRFSDAQIDYREYGGFELFSDPQTYEQCAAQLSFLNKRMRSFLKIDKCYSPAGGQIKKFRHIRGAIRNRHEGQINTGMLMHNLLKLAQAHGATVLNNVKVEKLDEVTGGVNVITDRGVFTSSKAVIATNGFASQLLGTSEVKPARAQVLITSPIKDLKIKGCYHLDEGYYYFRNLGNRVLFGGGRNLDIEGETTSELRLNPMIQDRLEKMLRETILPGKNFEIDYRWTGIMGVGPEKKPVIRSVGRHTVAAVRMGGMGIAIGTLVGERAARMAEQA
jgi:gamma-glutamylputrescine oxidase